MTVFEKIEEIISCAPPATAEELRHWVKVQREAGWAYETIYQKLKAACWRVAKELGH